MIKRADFCSFCLSIISLKINYINNPSINQTMFYTNVLPNKVHKFVRFDSVRQEVKHLEIKKRRLDVSANCRFHLIHKTAKIIIKNDNKEEIAQMVYKKSSFVLKCNKTAYNIVQHDEIQIVNESKQMVAAINVDLLEAYAMVGSVMIGLFDQQDGLIELIAIGMLLLMCDQSMMQMSAVMIVT